MNPEFHLSQLPILCSSEQGWQVPTDEPECSEEPETLMDGCAWIEDTLCKLMDKVGLREAFEEEEPEEGGGFEVFAALLSMLPRKSPSIPKDEPQPFALEMDVLPVKPRPAAPAPIAPFVAPKCKMQLEFTFPDEETFKSLARKRLSAIMALRAKTNLTSLMKGICTNINHCFGSEFSLGSGLKNFLKRVAGYPFATPRNDQTRCTEIIASQLIAQHRYLLRWKCRYRASWVLLCSLYTLIKRERLPLMDIGK
jgi:hypothetical protein